MESAHPLHPAVFRLTAPAGVATPVRPAPLAFPLGLGRQGVHEVCETRFGDMAALCGFVLAAMADARGAVAWVSQRSLMMDHGRLYASGISLLRQEPPAILNVQVQKPVDALWALEEVIRSGAVSLAIAELDGPDFTASRRLSLASSRHGVPVILLMPSAREGATAAAARWRVCARPSAPNRFDPRAPGHPRWRAVLERSRIAPQLAGHVFDLELNDETLSLSVVSGLASHTPVTGTQPAETRRSPASPDPLHKRKAG